MSTFEKGHSQHLHVPVGYECCNKCLFCMESNKKYRFKKVKNFIAGNIYEALCENVSLKKVIFSQGEPTLNPELVKYAQFARKQGYQEIGIVSNGRKYSDMNFCLELIQAGVNYFVVSIHGHDAHTHNALTRSPGSFEQTVQGIKNLSRIRQSLPIRINISHVVNKMNYQSLDMFLRLAKTFLISEVVLNIVQPLGANMERYFNKLMPRYPEIARKIEDAFELQRELFESNLPLTQRYVSIVDLPLCSSRSLLPMMGFGETQIRPEHGGLIEKANVHYKEKTDDCLRCDYSHACDGVYTNYVKHFGWEDFKAVPSENVSNFQ